MSDDSSLDGQRKEENMSMEELVNLRKRIADAVRLGVVPEDGKAIFETTLIQVMNDAERNRQRCLQVAEDSRRRMTQAEAQASAFSQISSIVYAIVNGFVVAAERSDEPDEPDEKLSEKEEQALKALAKAQKTAVKKKSRRKPQ
jgi:hypothetical protein